MIKEMRLNPEGIAEEVIWKDIRGFEGMYSINQFGDVKSHTRQVNGAHGCVRTIRERILKKVTLPNKLIMVRLWADGVESPVAIHRLVAEAFLNVKRDDMTKRVKHADRDPENLYYRNMLVVSATVFYKSTQLSGSTSYRIVCTNKLTEEKREFESQRKAAEFFGITEGAMINRIRKGKLYSGWIFKVKESSKKFRLYAGQRKAIAKLYDEGLTIFEISTKLKCCDRTVSRHLNAHYRETSASV